MAFDFVPSISFNKRRWKWEMLRFPRILACKSISLRWWDFKSKNFHFPGNFGLKSISFNKWQFHRAIVSFSREFWIKVNWKNIVDDNGSQSESSHSDRKLAPSSASPESVPKWDRRCRSPLVSTIRLIPWGIGLMVRGRIYINSLFFNRRDKNVAHFTHIWEASTNNTPDLHFRYWSSLMNFNSFIRKY